MEWRQDALGIYFAHMKNDQSGERPKDPRHVYSNPLKPEICVLLSLGIFLLCFPFQKDQNFLFSGSKQYDRYTKILHSFLSNDPDVIQELQRRGLKPEDLGSHSARKGAATFASSGSTACPPQAAINLRGGWSMPGVQSTYIRYEAAGDQFTGRTLAGLPIDRPEFAILPPHFAHDQQTAIRDCFPGAPASMSRVLEFSLAAVVHHRLFLQKTLPPAHRLFRTPLFSQPLLLEQLSADVKCGSALPDDSLRPTGVPPYVALLSSVTGVGKEVKEMRAELVGEVVSGMSDLLEEKAVGAGTVTRHGLAEYMTEVWESSPLYKSLSAFLAQHDSSASSASSALSSTSSAHPQVTTAHMWGGRFHLVPQDFSLPDGSALLAWQQYLCGDPARGYPPIRVIPPEDMPSSNLRKRLSDFKFLMRTLEEHVKAADRWIDRPTIAHANEMFYIGASALQLSFSDESSNKRSSQTKWLTLVKHLRSSKKRRVNDEHAD